MREDSSKAEELEQAIRSSLKTHGPTLEVNAQDHGAINARAPSGRCGPIWHAFRILNKVIGVELPTKDRTKIGDIISIVYTETDKRPINRLLIFLRKILRL